MECKTISFDTSTNSTGYAVFIDGKYERYGLIDVKDVKDTQGRMSEMIKQIYHIIDCEYPDICIWEVPVVSRNVQAQRNLTMITGAIFGKCIENDIFCYSFRPTEWRKLVSKKDEKLPRKRDELKEWGKEKVKNLFGIDIDIDDITDAILVGFAYMNKFLR